MHTKQRQKKNKDDDDDAGRSQERLVKHGRMQVADRGSNDEEMEERNDMLRDVAQDDD